MGDLVAVVELEQGAAEIEEVSGNHLCTVAGFHYSGTGPAGGAITVGSAGWDTPLRPVPALGEHTAAVLATLGLSESEIADLRANGTV